MRFDVQKAFERFSYSPNAQVQISKNVYLTATFKRRFIDGAVNWYVIARAVDKQSGVWFSAAASPFKFSNSRAACLRSALFGLAEEFNRR